jgi:regulator of sigma E protease
MFDFIWFDLMRNILAFIIALGILITVHEYGHFWVAKKNGVKVLRFSIGFGKAIWQKNWSGWNRVRNCTHSAWWLCKNA